MDTGIDFITPEFLNILFFQQKSIVIFPYVDLKHLHTLEILAEGYSFVDLDSTALHSIKEIIDLANDPYSHNRSFFFIFNIEEEGIKELISFDDLHCVINTNQRVQKLANGEDFVFYNKKTKKFLNYSQSGQDLSFERHLISSSEDTAILQDKLHKIKSLANRIFTKINKSGIENSLDGLPDILIEYEQKYWDKILTFMKLYYKIELPDIPKSPTKRTPKKVDISHSFLDEYELILDLNKNIADEFMRQLFEYRSNHVNSSNLDLSELSLPKKLYVYLREHHWKNGISNDFLFPWIRMELTRYSLTDEDQEHFTKIFDKLHISEDVIDQALEEVLSKPVKPAKSKQPAKSKKTLKTKQISTKKSLEIPSVLDFYAFKEWFLDKLNIIEKKLGILSPRMDKEHANPHISKLNPPKAKSNNDKPILFIDTTNLLHEDLDENEQFKVENISEITKEVEAKGYEPQHIVDSTTRHYTNNSQEFEKLIRQGIVKQSPVGVQADLYVLECAKRFNSKFLSNDGFRDHKKKYDKDWINENRLTCKCIRGKFIII